VRPVLLDHELVELAFSMPAAVRSGPDGLDGKRVLREVLRDRLPPEILARRKSGFGAPLEAWLAASRRSLVQTLATGRLVDEGILNSQGVRQLAPGLSGLRLWSLLMLERTWT
jgi:asparagine synthase (glutamine-hydrolysing)